MEKDRLTFAMMYRMRFIDFLLAEYGSINRSAIVLYFGLSQVQASNDFKLYLQLAPENMVYDTGTKTYRRSRFFSRAFP
jgi:hypothetical protein